jgi:hypothetical protein
LYIFSCISGILSMRSSWSLGDSVLGYLSSEVYCMLMNLGLGVLFYSSAASSCRMLSERLVCSMLSRRAESYSFS